MSFRLRPSTGAGVALHPITAAPTNLGGFVLGTTLGLMRDLFEHDDGGWLQDRFAEIWTALLAPTLFRTTHVVQCECGNISWIPEAA
jgi:hypothetical protein